MKIHRILIIRTDSIGDVILSLPVVVTLRKRYPDAYLAMLVQPSVLDIVEDHPDLDGILLDDKNTNSINDFFNLVHKIQKGRFDAALMLHPTLRLAAATAFACIPLRVGTGYRLYSFLFNSRVWEHRKNSLRHEAEYNLSLTEKLDADVSEVVFRFPVLPEALKKIEELLQKIGIKRKRQLVVLHPGTKGSALEWPRKQFALLADRFVRESGAQVLVTGGNGEEKVVDDVLRESSEKIFKAVGCFGLKELAALLKRADLLISNSTGPLHIGVAVGTEVIGVYPPLCPASARRWGPYGKSDSVLVPDIPECRKCLGPKCSQWNCMEMISVDDVYRLAERKLKKVTKVAK